MKPLELNYTVLSALRLSQNSKTVSVECKNEQEAKQLFKLVADFLEKQEKQND